MRRGPVSVFLLPIVLAAGCTEQSGTPVSPEGVVQLRLEPVGAAIQTAGFSTPESMVHDATADVYLVSNVNGHPQLLTNDGFISRVRPDGTIEELEWIKGGENGVTLHAPTGLVLVGDVLYVADADAVRLFDRVTGAPVDSWPVPVNIETVPELDVQRVTNILLNGVCAGPRGDVYLAGTGIHITLELDLVPTGEDAVYAFRNGAPVPIAQGADLMGPNGCSVVGANVFVNTLLSNEVYRLNASGKRFPVATLPEGGLDGFVRVDGFFFVGSVFGGTVYRLSVGGAQVTEVLSELVSPADLGFDHERNRLLIPSLFGDFVMIQPME